MTKPTKQNYVNLILKNKKNNKFIKYIDYIRFPKYKNFTQDTKITFDFPITVLVGKNGTGKSSILKALYGCPESFNIGDHWFSTEMDPIVDSNNQRNCLIYAYASKRNTQPKEVLIQRAPRKDTLDYWETAKPVKKYGMGDTKRTKQIKMPCTYIDFHSILSAFDVYKYFIKNKTVKEENNYLRKKSKKLFNSLNKNIMYKVKGVPQVEKPVDLTPIELNIISEILEKKYISGKIIRHKFFKIWSKSVILKTNKLHYSEAFAGSGETAIAILIHKLHKIQNSTLVLLDEPEVCLHPGAQKKLFDHLKSICLSKKLQIIISSHSPEFVLGLPDNAIKIFNETSDEKIEIINKCHQSAAFLAIGKDIENKKTIVVEDRLGKLIIQHVANKLNLQNQINVIIHPGGESSIKKSIGSYSALEDFNKFIIFDGDQNPGDFQKFNTFSFNESQSIEKLQNHLENILKIDPKKIIVRNSNETVETTLKRYKNCIEFFEDNCFFLPCNIPEEIIWDDEYAKQISCCDDSSEIDDSEDFKEKFNKLAASLISTTLTSDDIFNIQKIFVTNWSKKLSNNYNTIKDILYKILNITID